MSESAIPVFQNVELFCFFLSIAVLSMWELRTPLRQLMLGVPLRWLNNIGLFLFNSVLMRLLSPTLSIVLAFQLQEQGWGLFNVLVLPEWMAVVGAFILLDFGFYLKHRIAHGVPWFWRFHRVHHSDADFDLTTSIRFHPLDVGYQTLTQILSVIIIGAPPLAIAAHAVCFMVIARFQHSNVRLPEKLEKKLRRFLVTSDMHRIHHSARQPETDSNYGGLFPWFDRLLGTYVDEPVGGQTGMQVGLNEFSHPKHMTLWWMLVNPLLPGKTAVDDAGPAEAGDESPGLPGQLPSG